MVFGIIAAGMLYLKVTESQKPSIQQEKPLVVEDKEKKAKEKVEAIAPKMIPVSQGKRAMTIATTDVQGIAGFVKPGSYVDVIAVMEGPEKKAEEEPQHDSATLLLQNVKVLAIGHSADDEETKNRYQMVTVEVTPKEGLILGFSTRYELYLMLRQDGDDMIEPAHTHIHEDELHEGVFR
ncbi:MAG: Flp pilus assembly protein CpaB [Paenisporosarcina sp.]